MSSISADPGIRVSIGSLFLRVTVGVPFKVVHTPPAALNI